MRIISCFTAMLSLAAVLYSAEPALNFSDIVSGPKTGLGDGLGQGAVVTVWGNNLGSSQGAGKLYFKDSLGNVSEAAHIYYWKNADGSLPGGPADLYSCHKMQEIAFSVPASAADGAGKIYVRVGGVNSNELDFNIRGGSIYFIKAGGSNSDSGSWQSPWGIFENNASSKLDNGDLLYVVGEFNSIGTYGLLLQYNNSQNTFERPIAVAAYPGSSVYLNGSSNGIAVWSADPRPQYWVFSKMKIESGATGISSVLGMRAIANEITGPIAAGQSGAISGAGDTTSAVKCFGNYIHDFGLNDYSIRLHHVFYLSNRDGTPNAAYELGWNYLLNNHARGGLHNYDEGLCGDFTGIIKIHDNFVINQSGAGFDLGGSGDGYDGTGCIKVPFEVYNNVFINCGQAPFDDPAINVCYSGAKSHIKFYNNVIYGWSTPAQAKEAVYIQDNGSASWNFGGTFEWINNIVVDTNDLPYFDPVYYKEPSASHNNIWYNGGDSEPVAAPIWDVEPITADPLFTNPSGGDFSLKSVSPAVDNGSPDVSSVVLTDILAARRPWNGKYDIGAIEYTASSENSDLVPPSSPESLEIK